MNYNIQNMNKIILFLAFFMALGAINAQSLEHELGFIYVKAEYLLDTDRYEEAIQEFTKIVDKDPTFKDALYKRAKAKYAIAAFLGTKRDLLRGFEFLGISPEAVVLYGKTLRNLDEDAAATITQNTASMLKGDGSYSNNDKTSKSGNTRNDDADSSDSGKSHQNKSPGDVIKEEAKKIDDKVRTILHEILGRDENRKEGDSDTGSTSQTDNERQDGDTGTIIDIIKKQEEPEVEGPDVSVNEIFIDEDLTIFVQDGLGGRKILNQPNILILNETSGNISIDVCVNENGKVTNAEYNKNASSLSTQSLVSLAVRKSNEFWFEKSTKDEICGTFIFKISGRN